ncbi:unnamed protein product [Rotaria sp. Silwood2]|nr:unnamed protein product [Rotaria sp. Silwood2]CAF2916734.1 unnamed protein product [Rotaria sp. Silwood2]CAF3857182.1 unnamed protein product [Rotaria sp. Silwood2]CAF3952654.1 unnamed protein product [Rotaria sp. Silwood2]
MDTNLNTNNKRAANDGNDNQDNTNNVKRTRSTKVDLRFLLASRDAGAIIGRQGKNIQMLRSKYKTIIQVPDQDGPERILTIAGELEPCLDCLTDALVTMAENQKLRQDASELRALVHTSQAGAIIGKGGERVKELRARHGLEVKVFTETCPNSTDRVILCRGEQRAILSCLRDIFTQIEKIPPRGPIRPYDPSCYVEHQIQGYGGFAHDDTSVYGDRRVRGGGGGGGRGYNNNFDNWDMNNMRGGGGGGGGGMYNDDYVGPSSQSFYPPPSQPMMAGGSSSSGGGQGQMRPLIDSFSQPPATQTQQVTIPHELAGAIIGSRGTRISQIRQQSGASIKIDDPLPGTNDRIITIVGTPNQIAQAQHLLQTAVRQSGLYPG